MAELRYNKDGVPIYDGSPELFVAFQRAALIYAETVEWKKRNLVGPRLQAALEGSAKLVVEHKNPGWISHPNGASQLLECLKQQVRAPTLAEAGRTMSRFFYGIKRRRGEGMAAWIVRHDEALLEAKRTLAEAIHEYGPGTKRASIPRTSSWRSSGRDRSQLRGGSEDGAGPPDEETPGSARGDSAEGGEEPAPSEHPSQAAEEEDWYDQWWNTSWNAWQWDPSEDGRGQWTAPSSKAGKSWATWDASEAASAQAERFLPDFVIAWMLLQRSGLDASEKSVIVATLKNNVSISKVKEALKLTWPDEELRKRDSGKNAAMFTIEEEALLADEEGFEAPATPEWEDPEENYAYQALEDDAQEALAALEDARRTLKDAREKQAQMRRNRNFYQAKQNPQPRSGGDRPPIKCFRCGGNHMRRDCPQNNRPAQGEQRVHFVFSATDQEAAAESKDGQPVLLSVKSLRALGAVIDFSEDQAIFKRLNPAAVVKLQTTESGHQLFPLTRDVLDGATMLRTHKDRSLITMEAVPESTMDPAYVVFGMYVHGDFDWDLMKWHETLSWTGDRLLMIGYTLRLRDSRPQAHNSASSWNQPPNPLFLAENMPSNSMTKAEMQQKLASLGELAPTSWTKVQLSARIAELSQEQEAALTEREASKMINRCKTKAALQEMMTENGLEFTKSQTVDQLRGTMLRFLMEHKVPAGASNYMGFGKHSSLTYGQVVTNFTSYTTWCVETAANESECHWRLRRFALWAQGLSRTEKEAMSKKTENELETTLTAWKTPRRAAAKAYHPRQAPSASSGEPTESKWELMSIQAESQDQEMIPETSSSSTTRLAEVEAELRELKELIKNQMKPETEADEEDLAPAECCSLSFKVAKGFLERGQCFDFPIGMVETSVPVKVHHIPAEAHWQISVVERGIQSLKATMTALVSEQPDMSATEAFARAIWASNNRDQYSGYSPLQHAFGRSPNELGQLGESKLRDIPILTESGVSAEFGVDVKAMVTAEKAFLEEQAHARLRRAELSGARTMKHFCPGDLVYAWRRMTPKADGNKHFKGGQLVKAAPQQLRAATAREEAWNELNNQGVIPWTVSDTLKNNPPHQYEDISKDTEVMPQPVEICEALGVPAQSTMLLTKAAYGLVEAPIQWFLTISRFLESIGGEQQFSDPCCWSFYKAEKDSQGHRVCIGHVCGHVDDFLFGGSSECSEWKAIKEKIQTRFKWGQWEVKKFTQCGVLIEQDDNGFALSQPDYLDAVSEIHVSRARWNDLEAPINATELHQLRSVLGALSWHATQVAPQWSAPVSLLLTKIHQGTVSDVIETNKLLRKAKAGQHQKLYIHKQESSPLVAAWTDAANSNRQDGGSTKGVFVGWTSEDLLQGNLVNISPIFWQSAKIQRACRSSAAAETHAAADAEDELYAIRLQVGEFLGHSVFLWSCDESVKMVPGVLVTDSKNLYDRLNRTVLTFKGAEKRANIESLCLKESMSSTNLKLRWVNGDSQLANSLTKETELHQLFEYHRRKGQWRIVYDPELVSGRKRKQMGVDRLDLVAE
ncbi:unnamed protein product [Symbiodinium sp. KB8]|nr:unnamed protein product [Symbiodinium sp. KB8]